MSVHSLLRTKKPGRVNYIKKNPNRETMVKSEARGRRWPASRGGSRTPHNTTLFFRPAQNPAHPNLLQPSFFSLSLSLSLYIYIHTVRSEPKRSHSISLPILFLYKPSAALGAEGKQGNGYGDLYHLHAMGTLAVFCAGERMIGGGGGQLPSCCVIT